MFLPGNDYDISLIFPPIRLWDRPRNFPTGIGILAAVLDQQGFRTDVIDANGLRLSQQAVLDRLEQSPPNAIGIGGIVTTYTWVKQMIAMIRERLPGVPVILGGSVGSSIPQLALWRLDADIVVLGEGERTLPSLLTALQANHPIDTIPGLVYRRDDVVHQSPPAQLIDPLDQLPYPQWSRFPMATYLANPVVGIGRDMDVISSRGCPFSCRYCYRAFGSRFRARSADHVVGEIEALRRDYDIDFVSFQDDCFVVDRKRVYAICDAIERSRYLHGIRWSCTGRVSVCEPDLLRRMRQAGCVSVSYGIESGSQTILNAMNKQVTLEQARQTIRWTRQAGLRCPVSFMIGYPGETPDTVMETVDFCREMAIPLSALMLTCPYPGTDLYRQRWQSAPLDLREEESLVSRMGDAVDLTINLTDMTDDELIALRDHALRTIGESVSEPDPDELAREQRQLYGPELYDRAAGQRTDPAMMAHRRRHGFNEPQPSHDETTVLAELASQRTITGDPS